MKLFLFLFFFHSFLYARIPSWLSQPTQPYRAIGRGADIVSAERSAYSALSRQLSLRVEAKTTVRETLSEVEAQEELAIQSDETLIGAHIAERWEDKKGSVYALAVLNPKIMRDVLNKKRNQRIEEFNHLEDQYLQEIGILRRLSLFQKMEVLNQEIKQDESKLAVLGSSVSEQKNIYWDNNISLSLNVNVSPSELASLIGGCFPFPKNKNAHLQLKGMVKNQHKNTGYGLWITESSLILTLIERDRSYPLVVYQVKGGGSTLKESERHAEEILKETILQNLPRDFQQFLKNL